MNFLLFICHYLSCYGVYLFILWPCNHFLLFTDDEFQETYDLLPMGWVSLLFFKKSDFFWCNKTNPGFKYTKQCLKDIFPIFLMGSPLFFPFGVKRFPFYPPDGPE
jgi:hypothetical protein